MRFQPLLLLLVSLINYASGEHHPHDDRSHARDFSLDTSTGHNLHVDTRIEERDDTPSLFRRADPVFPPNADTTKLHIWLRLDTRPSTYDDRGGANHEGLNQLMKDTGGRHIDVIVGSRNPKTKEGTFREYGLMFADPSWQSKANGDGAPVVAYFGTYDPSPQQEFTYKGEVVGGRNLDGIARIGQ